LKTGAQHQILSTDQNRKVFGFDFPLQKAPKNRKNYILRGDSGGSHFHNALRRTQRLGVAALGKSGYHLDCEIA
jgi:hypothetical protein